MSDTKTTPSIDVRMYNHGLGDCFLLTIRGKGKEKAHMLIDCGLHGLQANKRGLFEKVLQDIRERLADPAGPQPAAQGDDPGATSPGPQGSVPDDLDTPAMPALAPGLLPHHLDKKV